MKKSTLEAIRNYLNGDTTVDTEALRAEVEAEWDKTFAKARANADTYAAAHDVVMAKLAEDPTTPMSAADLFVECEGKLPDNFTVSKLQYALSRMWQDELVRFAGSPATYAIKA